MREIVHIQTGQCGNQIGTKVRKTQVVLSGGAGMARWGVRGAALLWQVSIAVPYVSTGDPNTVVEAVEGFCLSFLWVSVFSAFHQVVVPPPAGSDSQSGRRRRTCWNFWTVAAEGGGGNAVTVGAPWPVTWVDCLCGCNVADRWMPSRSDNGDAGRMLLTLVITWRGGEWVYRLF